MLGSECEEILIRGFCLGCVAPRDDLRRFQKGLKARMTAQRIEVGIFFSPTFGKSATREHLFEAVDCFFRFSKKGVNAGHIVKNPGIVRIDVERPPGPRQTSGASGAFSHMKQHLSAEVECSRIIGVKFALLLC